MPKRATLTVDSKLAQHRWRRILTRRALPERLKSPITTRALKDTHTARNSIGQNEPPCLTVVPLCTIEHSLLVGRKGLRIARCLKRKTLRSRVITRPQAYVCPVSRIPARDIDNKSAIQGRRQLKATGGIANEPTLRSAAIF